MNDFANGNAWFVSDVIVAENADEEMSVLGKINTKNQAVVDAEFDTVLPVLDNRDTPASIVLESYAPNKLVYNYKSNTNQFAVFSEVFYDKGWNAYVDGKLVPYIRANYLLRAMPLAAGEYTIEFKFEPKSYSVGNTISIICSILFVLIVIGYIVYVIKYKKRENEFKIKTDCFIFLSNLFLFII